MSYSRLNDAQPVLPVVAARVLKVSPKGLRWLGDNGKIRFEPTGGEPSIRLYRAGDVLRLAEQRARSRAFRSLPQRASGMAKAELRQGSFRFSKSENQVPRSAAKAR